MPIEFPQFADPFGEFFTVCSRLKEGDHGPGLPEEPLDLAAGYKTSRGKAFVRMLWSPGKSNHLHVDAALSSAFRLGGPPKTTARLTELRKRLASFKGRAVIAQIIGFYRIPLVSLPPAGGLIFTGSNAIRLQANKSEIELTGAQLTFREADISTLRWELVKDVAMLEMIARRELTISDRYLIDAVTILESALSRNVLGTALDGKPIS